MNLSNLITEAQRLAGRVDRDFNDRTRRWINEAQIQWAASVPWYSLERTETFAADGSRQLVLPNRVLTIQWVGDKSNKNPLSPSRQLDREAPEQLFGSTTGAAARWTERGFQAVFRQPDSSGALVVQTTQSDTFSVYVAGLAEATAQSGTAEQYYFVEEKVDVTGSGPHTTVNSYVRVDVIGKDDFTPADVTVKSGSTLLARVPAHSYTSEYRVLEFMLIPTAGTLIDINYIQRPAPLIENYQVPHPSVDSEYLIWYTAGMIHHSQGQVEEAKTKRAHAEDILNRRIYKDRNHGDKDLRAFPDPEYWAHDDQYTVPENF